MPVPARLACKRTDYCTPSVLVPDIHALLCGVALDPCTNPTNPICAEEFYVEGGQYRPWKDRTYANPPWGEGLHIWLGKARAEAFRGHRIALMLSVSRTDRDYFQDDILAHPKLSAILYFRGKLCFDDGDPSMLASWMFLFNIPIEHARATIGHRGVIR